MNYPDLIHRLEVRGDANCKCVWCEQLESSCDCTQGHTPDDWKPTPESDVFFEAAAAIKKLHSFALKFCPKCDGCKELLLEGGIVESDGLHGKPCRVVCSDCHTKSQH